MHQKALLSHDCDTAGAMSPNGAICVIVAPHKNEDFDTNIVKALEDESMAKESVSLAQHVIVSPNGANPVAVAPHKHNNVVSDVSKASEDKGRANESVFVGRGITLSMSNRSGRKIAPNESFLNPYGE